VSFVVVYDACVLYPAPLRDLLVRLAQTGLFRARWTNQILDECFRSILANRPDLDQRALDRTRELMNAAVRDCLVEGYESLADGLALPDAGDRHVVAAAIRSGAQCIVTRNLGHFPRETLQRLGIDAQDPDAFVLNLVDLDVAAVVGAIEAQASALRNPPRTAREQLETLQQQGLVQTVAAVRSYFT
jgi:PIN domain